MSLFTALVVVLLAAAAPASAGAAWTAPQFVSPVTHDASSPEVAVDADGDSVFSWLRFDGTNYRVYARARSASGTLSAPQTLSAAGTSFGSDPQVAVDPSGDAVFAWDRFNGATIRVEARARAADGTLSARQRISRAGGFAPQIAVDASGDAVLAWLRHDGANYRVQARMRAADGTLSPVKTLSAAGEDASVDAPRSRSTPMATRSSPGSMTPPGRSERGRAPPTAR